MTVTNEVEVVVAGRVVVRVCGWDDGAAEFEIVIGPTVTLDSPVGDVLIVVVSAVGVAGDVELLGLPLADADDPPKILSAAALLVQPTYTPFVSFIGIAKHCCPFVHTVIWKLPALLQFPTLPAIHAISPEVHGDEKLRPEKRLL